MFCPNCGKELTGTPNFCPYCGAGPLASTKVSNEDNAQTAVPVEPHDKAATTPTKPEEVDISPKSRLATSLLAWFLGTFGAHRFYLGKIGSAVGMLILSILGYATIAFAAGFIFLGAVGIWALIDFIYAVSGNMRDKEGKLIKNW